MKKATLFIAILFIAILCSLAATAWAEDYPYLGDGSPGIETFNVMDNDGISTYRIDQSETGRISIYDYDTGATSIGSWDGDRGWLLNLKTNEYKRFYGNR